MRTTTDILNDFINDELDTTILVDSITLVSGKWRCVVGQNHWGKTTLTARDGVVITDADATARTISDFVHDTWFEVPKIGSETAPSTGLWTLPNYTFAPGTPKAVASEITASQKSLSPISMPIVWLMEIMQEKVSYDYTKDIAVTPIMKIFILDSTDYRNWINDDHRELAVRPTRNYADRLIKCMIRSKYFQDPVTDPVFINQIRFGESFMVQGKGGLSSQHISSLLNEHTSGVELRLEIPIKRICYD